jgi:subtilisin family serine protease
MDSIERVNLRPLMERSNGDVEITLGLIDGPVAMDHPELGDNLREVQWKRRGTCAHSNSAACQHGTFVAGILSGRRGSVAPAICPGCTLLVCPIFPESHFEDNGMPSATPEELANAIRETIQGGARVINISASLARPSTRREQELERALDYAALKGVLVVAAAGNQGMLGSSAITRHPWVIPVAACDLNGKPINESNLASSIGKRGLTAPGENVSSLGTNGETQTGGGTSAAAPFVTGTIALLWSEFPWATPTQVKVSLCQANRTRRNTVVPPLLDAWAAYRAMSANGARSV